MIAIIFYYPFYYYQAKRRASYYFWEINVPGNIEPCKNQFIGCFLEESVIK
jgi:hypothetical protein